MAFVAKCFDKEETINSVKAFLWGRNSLGILQTISCLVILLAQKRLKRVSFLYTKRNRLVPDTHLNKTRLDPDYPDIYFTYLFYICYNFFSCFYNNFYSWQNWLVQTEQCKAMLLNSQWTQNKICAFSTRFACRCCRFSLFTSDVDPHWSCANPDP